MKLGVIAAVFFVATVFAANWAIKKYGLVPVGPSLMAPAGVYFVGLAFLLRDIVQRNLGPWAVVGCIIAGAGLSLIVSTSFAVASCVAFLVSEFCDFAVYTPLSKRNLLGGIVASNVVGAIVDSFIFLSLAGLMEFFWGQVVGKLWITAPVVALLVVRETRRKVAPA